MRKKLIVVLLGLAVAAAAGAAVRVIRTDWRLEAYGPVLLSTAGAVGGSPIMETVCDTATGDRVYLMVRHDQVGGKDVATVQAMSVVARGCADWPR